MFPFFPSFFQPVFSRWITGEFAMRKPKKPTSYDRYLGLEAFSEGRCTDAWRYFGAHPRWDGQDGFFFRVWATVSIR